MQETEGPGHWPGPSVLYNGPMSKTAGVTSQGLPAANGGVQVIARVAQVLRALGNEPRGLSLTQLAQRLDLPRSTVQRIVTALVSEGLLASASPKGGVRLGPEFVRLAATSRLDLWREVEPFMQEIFKAIGETVDCAILDGQTVRVVAVIPAQHQLRAVADAGTTFPVHCSSKGKALLAEFDHETLMRMLPAKLKRLTPNTEIRRDVLLNEIEQVRMAGVAFDIEGTTVGICAVAIALWDPMGSLVAISVAVPTQRFEAQRAEIVRILLDARARALAAFSGPTY